MDSYSANSITEEQTSLSYNDNDFKNTSSFLEALRLSQYVPTFIDEGFESISAVREITETDLIALNVKRGHRRVIQRGIATLNGISPEQPLMIGITSIDTAPKMISNTGGNNSSEGSYTTSGYGSMRSPKLSLGMNPQYESSNSSQYASNSSNSMYQKNQSRKQSYLQQESSSGGDTMVNTNSNDKNSNNDQMEIDSEDVKNDVIDSIRSSSFSSNDEEDHNNNTNEGNTSNNNALKRKYRRHPKPDRDAPIKPPSAYIMFSNDARAKLKDHNMTFVEIAKIVGDQWKNLSSSKKKQYERTAMKAKDEYLDALNDYRQTDKYKSYQIYLNNFKSEQDATNRKIARLRKKAKRESPGSGSMGGSSSNGNDSNNIKDRCSDISLGSSNSTSTDGSHANSTDGGSNEQYGSQTRSSSSSNSSDIYKVHLKNNPPPPSIITTHGKKDTEPPIEEEENNGGECYSPQQTAPPLVDENVSKSGYHRSSHVDNAPTGSTVAATASEY